MRTFLVLFAIIFGCDALTAFLITAQPTHPIIIISAVSLAACTSVYVCELVVNPELDLIVEFRASLLVWRERFRKFRGEASFPLAFGVTAAYGCAFIAMVFGCTPNTFFAIFGVAFVLIFFGCLLALRSRRFSFLRLN